MYCGVAVLVAVNGQSTTDDDIDQYDSRLVDVVAELRVELTTTKNQLATALDRIAKLEVYDEKSQDSKFSHVI